MPMPTAQALAEEFAARLFVSIGAKDFDEVIRRNKEHAYDRACASHDFCDANMVMLDAVQALAPEVDVDDILQGDEWNSLWNEAWDIAKASGFSDFLSSSTPA